MLIYLIRHGQTTGDLEDRYGGDYDDHLSDFGKEQVKQLAEKLKDKKIEAIFASSRIRAVETAEAVSKSLNLKVQIVDDLRERNFYGPLTGMIKAEAKEKFPELVEGLKFKTGTIAGAEPCQDFKNRILKTFGELSKSKHQVIAIITHGGPISCFFREVFKRETTSIDDCAVIELSAENGDYKIINPSGVQFE